MSRDGALGKSTTRRPAIRFGNDVAGPGSEFTVPGVRICAGTMGETERLLEPRFLLGVASAITGAQPGSAAMFDRTPLRTAGCISNMHAIRSLTLVLPLVVCIPNS